MGVYIAVHCNFNRQSVLYIYIYTIEYRISRLANLDRSIDRSTFANANSVSSRDISFSTRSSRANGGYFRRYFVERGIKFRVS